MSRSLPRVASPSFDLDPSDELTRARLALDAIRMGSWIWDVEDDIIHGDVFTAELFDLGSDRKTWPRGAIFKNIHPDDVPKIQAKMAKVLEYQDHYEVEFRKFTDASQSEEAIIWVRNRAQVTERNPAGKAARIIGVCWDVTREKAVDEALKQVAADMDHRAKNAFAVIRAMINLGKQRATDITSFAEALRGQVEAIASAHAMTAGISRATKTPQAPVPLLDLVHASLKPWSVSINNAQDRITVAGDETATISSEAATSMSMMIHELAASSAQHGAFGPAGGSIKVAVEAVGPNRVRLDWCEDFETPLPDLHSEKADGFGSTLLIHSVATLRGEVSRDLTTKGLIFSLTMPN